MRERDAAWAQLMRCAQDGDGTAYERLLREVIPLVRSLARRHCRVAADVEEMVQETLLTVHRVRHTYDPARPFTPWLAAITSRRAIDTIRRRQRVGRHESADGALLETFADAAANNELAGVHAAEEVAGLLEELPARQREAIELLKLRELSLAQAAQLSGQSAGALKVNAHRALKALRALMQGRGKSQ